MKHAKGFVAAGIAIAVVGFTLHLRSSEGQKREESGPIDPQRKDEPASAAQAGSEATAKPFASDAATKVSTPVSSASAATRSAKTYFHDNLQDIHAVRRIYDGVLGRLPPSPESDLLAVYVAETVARNGSADFAQFMRDLHAALRDNSPALFDLVGSQESALKQDPFTYQMTLNLAARLDLPNDQKAKLLGGAMSIRFETDPDTGISPMSTNITNALILMKNYGITSAEAAPYIQHGVDINRSDPLALREFAARANTYYPGSVAVLSEN